MPIKRGDPWAERDNKYSSKPIYKPLPYDPRRPEIANGIVRPKMSR